MKVKPIINTDTNQTMGYEIKCLGCDSNHAVYTTPFDSQHVWGFNNNVENPTFTPSLLIRSGHYITDEYKNWWYEPKGCWCTYNKEHPDNPASFKCGICHSFITDGKIQYLSDCTHELAGQTIELPEIE